MSDEIRRGYVHIYCGDGKGKTSAAIGLAVRAAGRGRRILIARFLKNEDSGEIISLRSLTGVAVLPCEEEFGFSFRMTDEEREAATHYFSQLFDLAWKRAISDNCDVLILDEILAACNYHFVEEALVVERIMERPDHLEVVLTGRDPSEAIKAAADYISVIQMEKHPFTRGIPARAGIEY